MRDNVIDFLKYQRSRNREVFGEGVPYSGPFSEEGYIQPAVTGDVLERIRALERIARSIESNIVGVTGKEKLLNLKIDYEKELNQAQLLAATTVEGPLLVIAGAGSGKTRAVVYRVAYLLEKGVDPQKILLLTFTRKAAKEMLDRASVLLDDLNAQKVMGGTFHAFSNYILRKYSGIIGIAPNFTIVDQGDAEDIIDLVRGELKIEKKGRAFPKKGRLQEIISRARNLGLTVREVIAEEFGGLAEYVEDIEKIEKAYTSYKRSHNILDYDDLLELFKFCLEENRRFRERVQDDFQYLMVDEFQDTNAVQKEIVDLMGEKHRNVMVVGDDSQSIYSFRGANFENILRFPETYPDCKIIKLEQNYRSSQAILDFTNAIIDNARIGYRKRLFSNIGGGLKPLVKKFYSQEEEAEFVVSMIQELREEGVPLNEIAVLYRATYHGNFIQAELLKKNIPYVVYGGIRFIERRHVKDVLAHLRITLNPYDSVAWNRVLKLIPGVGNATASRIIKHVRENKGELDPSKFKGKKYADDLAKLARVLDSIRAEEVPPAAKVETLKNYYLPLLRNLEYDYQTRILDIDVLYTLACRYDELERFLSDLALDPPSNMFQDKSTPLIDESEEKPLVLSTIHSAKGLEWNTVFIPHLLDGLFPTARSWKDIRSLEEERRLFYVACTRAKRCLFLTMPHTVYSYYGYFTLPSRFLAEIDSEKYEMI